ncbi:hypothetical protein AMS68_008034 [Peltaster fructicola]|uniref:TAFII28-like protein domain-containing protein n=1 Tax=Peltaster fructicola TaxID=286661 RepID=A0A6H0Y633_9PEZI|nr:hypothetical protein AMS68_008034 [Peltaster fructicola]
MASAPNYSATSPPAPSSLALPRQRPTLSLPTGNAIRRKTSIASATSSSHPLRQTSFPPADRYGSPGGGDSNAVYSPTDSADISDSEITSAISGPVGELGDGTRKRKRGEKRNRGRPPKNPALRQGSQSVVNGADDGKSRRSGRGDSVGADGDADEDDEEDEDDGVTGGDRAGAFEQDRFIANDRGRIDLHQQMTASQQERHDSWHRAKLKIGDVRKLVNATLSQSVPANVVTVVQAYTKMFAGIIIEEAREVQSEWMAVEAQRADGSTNPAAKKLKLDEEPRTQSSTESTLANGTNDHSEDTAAAETAEVVDAPLTEAIGLGRAIEECDRGPLLADHLRESLRRYKKSRYGGVVGFTGQSLEGRSVAAARLGGRRLFR